MQTAAKAMAIVMFLSATLLTGGCYSFTGASVPAHLHSVAIPLLPDQSGFGDPQLPDEITQSITQNFIQDNTLQVTNRGSADAILEGSISSVRDEPLIVQGTETVSKRRITVTVNVKFQDMKLKKTVWQKDFSNWGDYDSGGGFSQRQAGITEAIRKISEDILLQTVSNW